NSHKNSSSFIDPSDTNRSSYYFTRCNFGGKDTIIAYGSFLVGSDPYNGLIVRSTDGGLHWGKPVISKFSGLISRMSRLDRDSVIAGGYYVHLDSTGGHV